MMMCQNYNDHDNDQSNNECACNGCCECENENENGNKRKAVGGCHLPYPVGTAATTTTRLIHCSPVVFGVDSKKRINLWNNESCAAIISSIDRIFESNSENSNEDEIIGMPFDNMFPSSSFLSSTSSTSISASRSSSSSSPDELMIPLIDVLDKVIRNGKAEVNVDVKLMKVRHPSTIHNDHHQVRGLIKRTRRCSLTSSSESTTAEDDCNYNNNNLNRNHECGYDDNDEDSNIDKDNNDDDTTTSTTETIFSVDLFPQFDITTTTDNNSKNKSKRIVTGVVLVCTNKRVIDNSKYIDDTLTTSTEATTTTVGSGATTRTSITTVVTNDSEAMTFPAISSYRHQQQHCASDASLCIDPRVTNNYNSKNNCSNCITREKCSSCNSSSDATAMTTTANGSGGGVICTANSELRKLIDTANIAIFGIDCNGIINEWNDNTAEITGYEKRDAFGSSLVDTYIKPNIRKSMREILNDAINDGKCKSNCEIDFRTKYNEIRHLLVNITPQRDMDNNIIGAVMMAQDVTEAVKRDRSVTGMALELRQLIDTANAPIFGIDCDMNVNEWNRKISEITGYTKEEATGVPLVETFIAPLAHMKVDEILEHALTGFETSNYELEVISKSGESIFLLVNATTRRDPEGLIIGVVGVAQDVTEDRKKAKELLKLNIELRKLIDTANMAIFGIDCNGIINEWNDNTAEITGYEKKDAFGLSLVDTYIKPNIRKSMREILNDAINDGKCKSNYEIEFCTKYNEIRHLLVNITPQPDMDNNIIGAVMMAQDVTEAVKRDRSVAGMAFELRQLINTANAPIFGIDCDMNVNEWNRKISEITGYTKEEATGVPLVETFIAQLAHMKVDEILERALAGFETSNYELEVISKTGESIFLLVNATTRRDPEGLIIGVVGVAQDVTEDRKKAKELLKLNIELRKLIDTANMAIFGIDCNGIINEWNDNTAEITGYEKRDAFGSSLVDTYIKPNIRRSMREILNDAINDGKCKSNYGIEFCTKDNEIRHLLVNITPQPDMDNNIIGAVMMAQDVTEAVKRDRSVTGMALELRQLIDTANAPIFGIDCDMNVNEWNRKISEITGYTKEEATGVPLVETFIAPLAHMKVDEILEHALTGFETSNYELEVISKSGESIFLLVNATTRRDPEGLITGVVGVAQDVTEDRTNAKELRKLETLRASQEAKVETERNMTAYFAHELRNPLGAIDSALNSMPDDLPQMAQSLISGMQLCSTFMSKIMNNLLDVRKMEEGKMQLRKAPISLFKLLFNVHKMLLPSCRPGVDFRTTLPKYDATKENSNTNDWVIGDQHRIEQVLTNVISNSIKYTLSGYIELSIMWEDGNVKFICEDSGPGIPIQEQKKLFQRFIQRGGAPGTGLGLAIAKHVVDLTGGSIRFESDPSVKAGTSCIVLMTLPLCKPPAESTSPKKKSEEVIQEPISCLIIDDIKMNRTMLKRRMKKGIAPNATMMEAATGEEALLICGRDHFDVIVVDQFMEGAGGVMVGTDVCFALRRMKIDSIIIGCSGNDIGNQFIDAGADWVWQKPMPSNDKIIQDLRTSLGKRNNSS